MELSEKNRNNGLKLKILLLTLGLLLAAAVILLLIYLNVPLKSVYRFSLKETDVVMSMEDRISLTPVFTVIDEDREIRVRNKKNRTPVEYKSLDERVVRVDEKGKLIPQGKGKTDIQASWGGMTTSVPVRVYLIPESVTFNSREYEMEVGEMMKPDYSFSPADADVQDSVRFSSSDESLAAVSEDGTVKAFQAGDVQISLMYGNHQDTCTVHLLSHLEGLVLDETELHLNRGEGFKFSPRMIPENNTDDLTYSWSSSNEMVAAVTADGIVVAIDYGEADIMVTAGEYKAVCHVKVSVPLEGMTLQYPSVQLQEGSSFFMPVYYQPADFRHETQTVWTSTNEEICTVHEEAVEAEDGSVSYVIVIETNHVGEAGILGRNEGIEVYCPVSVTPAVSNIEISQSEASLSVGEQLQLFAYIMPENIADTGLVYWVSSNPDIAAVSNGRVQANSPGIAVVSAIYGDLAIHCVVTVNGQEEIPPVQHCSGRIMIGDSRTVYLSRFVTPDPGDIVIAKGAQYFSWFANEAVPSLRNILQSNPYYEVIINMGVNDCANNSLGWTVYFAEDYAAMIRSLQQEFPQTRFFFASVGHCDGLYSGNHATIEPEVVNEFVDLFNRYMREACPDIPYIDLCEYLDASGYKTLDGVHYDQATCQKIYDYYKQTTPLY